MPAAMAAHALSNVRKPCARRTSSSSSAVTNRAAISSKPLLARRLRLAPPDTSAASSVTPVKASTGAASGHACAARTSRWRSRQSQRIVSAMSADSDSVIDSPRPTAKAAKRLFRSRSTSVGVAIEDDAHDRQRDDLEVEPERPTLDVLEIVLDALLERRVAAEPVDLCPARHPGLHLVPEHVAGYGPAELLDEERSLRSRADHAHPA